MEAIASLLKTMTPTGEPTCEAFDRVAAELAECEGCTGTPCRKTFYQYLVPDRDNEPITRHFILDALSVLFADMPTLLGEIQSTFGGKGDAQTIIDRYVNCDLLILDDLGVGKVTDWNVGVLSKILNARYNADKATVLMSNYDLAGLQHRLPNVIQLPGRGWE